MFLQTTVWLDLAPFEAYLGARLSFLVPTTKTEDIFVTMLGPSRVLIAEYQMFDEKQESDGRMLYLRREK